MLLTMKAGIAVSTDRTDYKQGELQLKVVEHFLAFLKEANMVSLAKEVLLTDPPDLDLWPTIQEDLKEWATTEKQNSEFQKVSNQKGLLVIHLNTSKAIKANM